MLKIKVLTVQNNQIQITDGTQTRMVTREQLETQVKAGRVSVELPKIKCLSKQRDYNNKITAYLLTDNSGKKLAVSPEQLKKAIYNYQVDCVNLTLTSDNRLIDKEEKVESTPVINEQVKNTQKQYEISDDYITNAKRDKKSRADKDLLLALVIKDGAPVLAILFSKHINKHSHFKRGNIIIKDTDEFIRMTKNDEVRNINTSGETISGYREVSLINYAEYYEAGEVILNEKIPSFATDVITLGNYGEYSINPKHSRTTTALVILNNGYKLLKDTKPIVVINGAKINIDVDTYKNNVKEVIDSIQSTNIGEDVKESHRDWAETLGTYKDETNTDIIKLDIPISSLIGKGYSINVADNEKMYTIELLYNGKKIANIFRDYKEDKSSLYGSNSKDMKYIGIGYDKKLGSLGFITMYNKYSSCVWEDLSSTTSEKVKFTTIDIIGKYGYTESI